MVNYELSVPLSFQIRKEIYLVNNESTVVPKIKKKGTYRNIFFFFVLLYKAWVSMKYAIYSFSYGA